MDTTFLEALLIGDRSQTAAFFHFSSSLIFFGPVGFLIAAPAALALAMLYSSLLFTILTILFYTISTSLFTTLFFVSFSATTGLNFVSMFVIFFVLPFFLYALLLYLIYDQQYCTDFVFEIYGENNVLPTSQKTRCNFIYSNRNTIHVFFVTWIVIVILIISEGFLRLVGI